MMDPDAELSRNFSFLIIQEAAPTMRPMDQLVSLKFCSFRLETKFERFARIN